MIHLDSVVHVVPDHVSADLNGETVVLKLDGDTYYALEGVGSRIWELIKEPKRVAAVRDRIVAEYHVDGDTCERDVLRFLQNLASESLIEVAQDGPD